MPLLCFMMLCFLCDDLLCDDSLQAAVIDHIGPLDAYSGEDYEEAIALIALSAVQTLYPLVAVTEVVWMRATGDYYAHNEFSPHLSTVKVDTLPRTCTLHETQLTSSMPDTADWKTTAVFLQPSS